MTEIIIQTRIKPKKNVEKIISRNSLTKLINDNVNKNLILICGPAGYGKTTLVQDFLFSYKKTAAWFHLSEDISNFYLFITYIVYSLKTIENDFGKNVLDIIKSMKESLLISKDQDTVISTVVGTLVNDFVQYFDGETILVLDDFHKIENFDWIKLTFKNLWESIPENLHIIITTRQKPGINLSTLRSKRKLLEIGINDLYISNEEIKKVIDEIYSINLQQNDISFLEKKLRGWITGIHLIIQAYGDKFNKARYDSGELPENIFQFFANDIFINLDDDTRNFLLQTALLENFTPELCDWLLERTESIKIIDRLIEKNIFIETQTDITRFDKSYPAQIFNYHSLFRQYLLTKLKELKTEKEINHTVSRLSEYYKNKQDLIQATNYSLLSKNYPEAIELIINVYKELFEKGSFEILWNWLSVIPEDIVNQNYHLLFFAGTLQLYYKGNTEKAHKYFTDGLNNSNAIKDVQFMIDCRIQKAETLRLLGKPNEAIECLQNISEIKTSTENIVRINYAVAMAYYRLGAEKYNEIIRLLNESIELCTNENLKQLQIDLYDLLGKVYHQRGEFTKSLFYYEIIVKTQNNIYKKFDTLTNIILLHSWSGNYLKAKQYLDETEILNKTYNALLFNRKYIRIMCLFYFECGDYENAILNFENLIEIETRSNIKFHIYWYYQFIGECYYYLNKIDKSNQYYELALKFIDEKDEYQKLENELHKTILYKKTSNSTYVEKVLLKALKYFDDRSLIYSKAQIEFHLADYYYKSNNPELSLQFLRSSLKISSEKQYLSYLGQSFFELRYLFDFAQTNKLYEEFIISIMGVVFEKMQYNWLSEDCKKRLLKETPKLYDIGIKTFGGGEISLRGEPIPESKWIRKKSKQILIYLLLNPTMKFTKETIMDIFFQDVSTGSAENLFHQVITNIRSALTVEYNINSINKVKEKKSKIIKKEDSKPFDIKQDSIKTNISPEFIVYENKILKINPHFNYYNDALIFNRLFNVFKSSESSYDTKIDTAKQAIELYSGEFLAGYYETWCEELRENYISKMIDLLENLIKMLKQKHRYYDIITYGEKLLQLDKFNEDAYLELIEAYANIGNISMAKKKFSIMVKTYEAEYGEKPSRTIMDKVQKYLLQ